MANSKDGHGHKGKYFDISTKLVSQEMLMCKINDVIFLKKGRISRYQKNDPIFRNILVKYQSSRIYC